MPRTGVQFPHRPATKLLHIQLDTYPFYLHFMIFLYIYLPRLLTSIQLILRYFGLWYITSWHRMWQWWIQMKLNRYKIPPITPSYLHMPYQSLRHSVLNNACHKKCQNIRQFSRYITYSLTNCLLKLYILPNIFIPLRRDNDFNFVTLGVLGTINL